MKNLYILLLLFTLFSCKKEENNIDYLYEKDYRDLYLSSYNEMYEIGYYSGRSSINKIPKLNNSLFENPTYMGYYRGYYKGQEKGLTEIGFYDNSANLMIVVESYKPNYNGSHLCGNKLPNGKYCKQKVLNSNEFWCCETCRNN